MRVPFLFSMTATAKNGLLWGDGSGHAATTNNTYAPAAPANRRAVVQGYNIQTDTVTAQCMIGVYDITSDTFTAKATVNALVVAGEEAYALSGETICVLDLYDPANPTHVIVPAIQLVTGATLKLSCDLEVNLVGETGEELQTRLAALSYIALEEDLTQALEEDNTTPVNEEFP